MNFVKRAGFWILFFIAGCVSAQEDAATASPLKLTIEDAVFMCLQHNRDLAVQQSNPVIAGAFEQIERGVYDPELFASLGTTKENSTETARSTGSQFEVAGNDTEAEVGLRQRLALGTELEVAASTERTKSNRTPEQQSSRVGLTLTQQLLRGFGPAVNLARIRQAKLDTQASRAELRGFTEALVADVEMSYWRYVAAREAISVFQKSLEVAQSQLEEVESRIEVGALPRNEAAAARAELALHKQDLIVAQSLHTEQRYMLVRHIYPGLSAYRSQELNATSRPDSDLSLDPDIDERTNLALSSRPELEEAKLRLQRNELETVVTRNGRLPRLELFINLGKSGYADTFQESFQNLDGPNYDVTVGIEFSQAIGRRASQARNTVALTTMRQAEEALANLRDLVRFDVLLAINELDRARKQISASAETCLFRGQILQGERDRFEVGSATALDVAQAQRDLVESQIAQIKARVAYQIARVRLYLAEGSLLDRRGIVVGSM
ncbi:MAG: TolC family protein [Kiritimatiellales bacterium]|nr:TolC family protein [Kiritimatiellales bacterium]